MNLGKQFIKPINYGWNNINYLCMKPSLDILSQQLEIQNVHVLKHENECKKKTSLDSRISFNLSKIDLLTSITHGI